MSIIEVAGLHKRDGDTVAVDEVSLSVEAGEIFGVLGPNGAGKPTTVECLLGLRRPDPRSDPGARPRSTGRRHPAA